MKKLRVIKHGYNGSATFSLFLAQPPTELITGQPLEEVANHIIKEYPDIAEKVAEANQIMKGAETGDINFSLIDCTDRAELVKLISGKFNAQQKKMAESK